MSTFGSLGTGSVCSGAIYSGQISSFHIASGSISSGSLMKQKHIRLAIPSKDGTIYCDSSTWQEKLFYALISDTEKGLCTAIYQNCKDPDLRLVYSDWLEEQGRLPEAIAEREAAEHLKRVFGK